MRAFARVALGFVVAPAPLAVGQALVFALWPRGTGFSSHPEGMFLGTMVYAYACQALLGVPLWLAIRRRRPADLRLYALCGLAIMLLPMVISAIGFRLTGYAPISLARAAYTFVSFGLGGLAAGALFWGVARPDLRARARAAEVARHFD
ncbi:hypothetical protein E2493_12330 [Sphingomonas parva]|uniref:Uncharacterized protein n=1 Tax=Sphingomonas parva TaxID=2555898 RepID=A0A4Y8ZU42_9SPHN|nr:hypothetical protein [Sphingomonas parva]TFI57976.1 hypothetical protein E2493_12330 [Sphingomonas parva]